MPIQPPEKTAFDYETAYMRANGKAVDVEYKRGWFVVRVGGFRKSFRESELMGLTAQLNFRARQKEMGEDQ